MRPRKTATIGPLPHPRAIRAQFNGPVPCEYFALCDRLAEVGLDIPALESIGPVATCSRCAAKVAALELEVPSLATVRRG